LFGRFRKYRNFLERRFNASMTITRMKYSAHTLGAYLRLPKFYAQMQPLADGRTASQTLLDQLRVLGNSLKEVSKSAFAGDAESLVTNGHFLQNKFSEKLAFRP
jgi:hypothetical protein